MKTLGEICEAIVDCEHKTAPTQDDGIPLIRTTNIANGRLDLSSAKRVSESTYRIWTRRMEPLPGDIILAREAPVGEVGVVPSGARVCLGQRTVLIRPDPQRVVPRFLLYAMLTPEMQHRMASRAHGSTNPHLNVADIRGLRVISLLAMSEQERVAALLGAIDDKIELNRRSAATARTLGHAMFRSRYRTDDPCLPHDPLGQHVEVARGLSYTGAGLAPDGMSLHNLNSIHEGGGYKRAGIKFYRAAYQERHLVEPGDVLVATVEQGFDELLIAFPARVPQGFGERGLFSQDLFRLRPRTDSPLSRTFIYLALLPGPLHEEVAGYANGTTINRIPIDALQRPRFAVPSRELVAEIDGLVTPLFDRAEAAEDESQTLAALRDALLPKLISGELRIRDA